MRVYNRFNAQEEDDEKAASMFEDLAKSASESLGAKLLDFAHSVTQTWFR